MGSDYKIKKDKMLGNELKNTVKSMTFGGRRSGDRLGRSTFTISVGKRIELLIGSYLNEGTNYAYDNETLLEGLKAL